MIYAPYSANTPPKATTPERVSERTERLLLPTTAATWWRAFAGFAGRTMVGQIAIDGGRLDTEKHRGTIGMGILEGHRGKGLGEQLLSEAILWARATPGLDWLDLGVFLGNQRALALYTRLGFVETGRVVDRFRIDGKKLTDIEMTLSVAAE